MIGDDVFNDVGGAKRCGLAGVLVRTGKYRYVYSSHILTSHTHVTHTLQGRRRETLHSDTRQGGGQSSTCSGPAVKQLTILYYSCIIIFIIHLCRVLYLYKQRKNL